jgi:hypothetical protein
MKVVYRIGWKSKQHHGSLPIKFSQRPTADRLAAFLSNLFGVSAWSSINNVYTRAEIAEIKAAGRRGPPVQKDWHWEP